EKFLAGAGEPEHKVAPSEDSPNQVEGKGKKSLRQLESALGLAVRHGHARVVRLFFEEGDFRGHYHYRAFLAAAASGNHLETARVLIEEGAEVNGINQLGYPGPFYWAVIRSDPELVKLFIESGADVDRGAAGRGITFLHKAATIGRTAVVRMLLDSGANPNAKATEKCSLECVNQTPLHCAAEKGHLETAKLLVSWGAKTDAEDALGWTPLEEAAFGGHREVYDFLKEVTVKKRGSGSEHIN
ncbi:MAG: ankyrin repeat domain-containing protein, partial [Planctomycetes bacterium]|nr:ankyrin repeat domain-containing protein [Planctomycetota bacterium]